MENINNMKNMGSNRMDGKHCVMHKHMHGNGNIHMKNCMKHKHMNKNNMFDSMDERQKMAFATPELRTLFDEWLNQINNDLLNEIKKTSDLKIISENLGVSEDSVNYLLFNLSKKGKINLKIEVVNN